MKWVDELRFNEQGLIPVVVQADSGMVLMLAWANRKALERTLNTGRAWFWSRSRGELWEKGATSGNYLLVHEVRWDCDADALLYRVKPCGPACHTGAASCFYQGQVLEPEPSPWILTELYDLVLSRMAERPAGSYVTKLLEQGRSRILQKVGEEATEVILAGAFERHDEVVAEAADLLFHLVVMLGELGVAPGEIWRELQQRRR